MIERTLEKKLIRKAKAGDGEAIAALIRAHQTALYAFILRMSGQPELAEDIVQEAFVRVIKNLDRFDDRFRFSTWLFTIAKRLFVNAVQKHKPTYDTDTVGLREGASPNPGGESAARETTENARAIIDMALEALSPQQREIVLLFHQLGWSINETAEHLDMPEGTVKSHLHRARKRMRECIETSGLRYQQVQEIWS